MPDYYRIIALLLTVGLAITWGECLANRKQFQASGVLSWEVLRLVRGGSTAPPRFRRLLNRLLDYPGFLYVVALHGAALIAMAGLVAVGAFHPLVHGGVLVTLLLMNYRNWYSLEGADQMLTLVAATVLLYSLDPDSRLVATAGLWFIGLQAVLAYFAAGVAKLLSPTWRSGEALRRVVNTETYGTAALARLLHGRPTLSRVLSWQVIAFQVLFPLALISGPTVCLLLLAWGGTFHVVSAVVMGLHRFVWAFLAAYPAIWYCMDSL